MRYFHRLGLAIIGKDYIYGNACIAQNKRVEKAESSIKQLNEMYAAALNKWNTDAHLAKKASQDVERLKETVANYQKLVETLRGTIRDKQAMIDAYVQAGQKIQVKNNR